MSRSWKRRWRQDTEHGRASRLLERHRHQAGEANGFTTYIASGGDRDFMRPIAEEMYGIPPQHVIGSSNGVRYAEDEHGGAVIYEATPDVFDDGPVKPVRIWSRIGRRPVLAFGNSNGDIPMLPYAAGRPPALDGGEHQERLGDGLRRLIPGLRR